MGLFSSKSSSTTNLYDYSKNVSATLGDFSDGNTIAAGDINYDGLSEEQMQVILDNNLATLQVNQSVLGKAIDEVSEGYATAMGSLIEADSETKKLLTSLQPFALYGAVAVVVYYLFK